MSTYKELRERTQREMALAGNHWDAISRHLDAYEAAYAHELAEKIYHRADEADVAGQRSFASGAHAAGTWIDPKRES